MRTILTVSVMLVALVLPQVSSSAPKPIPHLKLWLCIHSGEGSWQDSGSPYWGGLQMGEWFVSHYAPREFARYGYPHNWSPRLQMEVAERAYRREGFSTRWLRSQWPNTSPPCLAYA